MNDTIYRQAAIDAVQQHREGVLGGYEYDEGVAFVYAAAHNHIIAVIKQLPSAERRGRWIDIAHAPNGLFYATCSVCGKRQTTEATNYCGNCGAKMEGEKE